ncbi:MAG: heparinase, partial [Pseudomonadota bacterium]
MEFPKEFSARYTQFLNRFAARRAALGRSSTAFIAQPEPRTIGSFARGKQLSAGNFLFAGHLLQQPDTSMWDLPTPEHAFAEALHGFGWLDDIVAAGDAAERACAQQWLWAWIDRFGNGQGPGWSPDLTGRRLIRWISYALFLLNGQPAEASHAFHRSLAMQTNFLGWRWKASAPGISRFEALTGLIYASTSLEGMERHFEPAVAGLDKECRE